MHKWNELQIVQERLFKSIWRTENTLMCFFHCSSLQCIGPCVYFIFVLCLLLLVVWLKWTYILSCVLFAWLIVNLYVLGCVLKEINETTWLNKNVNIFIYFFFFFLLLLLLLLSSSLLFLVAVG